MAQIEEVEKKAKAKENQLNFSLLIGALCAAGFLFWMVYDLHQTPECKSWNDMGAGLQFDIGTFILSALMAVSAGFVFAFLPVYLIWGVFATLFQKKFWSQMYKNKEETVFLLGFFNAALLSIYLLMFTNLPDYTLKAPWWKNIMVGPGLMAIGCAVSAILVYGICHFTDLIEARFQAEPAKD